MKNCISIAFLISLLIYVPELQSQCIHVPDELYRGRLNSARGNYGHPYTMFDRRKSGNLKFNATQEIQKIRNKIIEEKKLGDSGIIFQAYKAIYKNANQGLHALLARPIKDGGLGVGNKVDLANGRERISTNLVSDSAAFMNGIVGLKLVDWTLAVSPLAQWAKNNAFVFLIGLDSNANFIDTLDNTFATRNQFRDRALDGFANLSGMNKAPVNYTHLFEGFLAGELLGILTGC